MANNSADGNAAYWTGPITRREVQDALDTHANCIKALLGDVHGNQQTGQEGIVALIAKLDCSIAFLYDRLGIKPADFQAYLDSKMAEFAKVQEAAKTAAEAPRNKTSVSIN